MPMGMTLFYADRVKETSTSTGTESFTLLGAVEGFQSFTAALIDEGEETYFGYTIENGAEWEVGIGGIVDGALERGMVLSSSNVDEWGSYDFVDFGPGTKTVFLTVVSAEITELVTTVASVNAGVGQLLMQLGTKVSTTGNETIAGTKTFTSAIAGSITGNAATATKLATARTINGVAFDGSANITIAGSDATKVPLAGGTMTGNLTVNAAVISKEFASTEYDQSVGTPFSYVTWTNGANQVLTLVGSPTLVFMSPRAGSTYKIRIVQDSTGGRTITWPATVKWVGGTAPTLSTAPNAVDIVTLYYTGSAYYGMAGIGFA